MRKNIRSFSLIMNIFAIIITAALLIGSTFAWFTDSATSSGNKIQAGTLKIDLQLLEKEDDSWVSLKNSKKAIFDYENWEPGYTDVKILRVVNDGTLALQWKAKFTSKDELGALADVIDVYVKSSDTELTYPADRSLDGYVYVGTVADFVNTLETTTNGILVKEQMAYLGIALKMQKDIGNEYQGLSIGGTFDIQIVATQLSSENDGFGDDYDSDAKYLTSASTLDAFFSAIDNGEDVFLNEPIAINADTASYIQKRYTASTFSLGARTQVIDSDVTINGNGSIVYRTEELKGKPIFSIEEGYTLTLSNITLDGGAKWTGGIDPTLNRGTTNSGIKTSAAIVAFGNDSHLNLNEGAIVRNNDGAIALNLGTRIGATLTLNGGEVINNCSEAGAIWGGGNVTINSGKVNYNNSTGLAGAIRMVSNCSLTMNGGEINNNKAATTGGVAWGYGASTFNLLGGEMANNTAETAGAIYAGDGSIINISGDFKLTGNTAKQVGALRLSNRTTLNMSGGLISGNVSIETPAWDGFYGWNPGFNFTGGVIEDSVMVQGGLTPDIGNGTATGVIYFDLGTNHNTCNLKAEFGTIRFIVTESDNFAAFNFKPASGYTYTEGDEAKLICLNEGYETYWDAEKNVFKIKAN